MRRISANGPAWSGEAWRAAGRNSAGTILGVEIYCADPSQLPGYTRVEHAQSNAPPWETTITVSTRHPSSQRRDGGWHLERLLSDPEHVDGRQEWRIVSSSGTVIRAWCVAAGTPTVAIIERLAGGTRPVTRHQLAVFNFTGSDPAGFANGFKCSLDGTPPVSCSRGSQGYGPLATGPHQFTVFNQTDRRADIGACELQLDRRRHAAHGHRAEDPEGVARRTGPGDLDGYRRSTPASGTTTRRTGRQGADGSTIRVDAADSSGESWPRPRCGCRRLPPARSLCISVRASDGVGNFAPWTAPRCTFRPYDDRSLRASTGWNRGTGDSYWKGTITTTTGADKTLRRLDTHLDQVGLLATVCPTCGKVEVAVGGTRIRQVSLERTTTTHQKVLLLPAFAATTGTVTITSVTTGKSIRIDGLITARTTDTVPPT